MDEGVGGDLRAFSEINRCDELKIALPCAFGGIGDYGLQCLANARQMLKSF